MKGTKSSAQRRKRLADRGIFGGRGLDRMHASERADDRGAQARGSLAFALRYGSGYIGIGLVTQTMLVWLAYFYAPPAESGLTAMLPVTWVGWAILLGRIVDGIADPVVGAWSDATRSSIGRRRPFLLWGALPLAASFAALWWAPLNLPDVGRLVYLGVMVSLFLFFFTVYTAPYLALLPELATTRPARVRLATWQGVAQIVGLGIAMIGSGLLIDAFGFTVMGIILAVVALVSFLIPALTIREEPREHAPTPGMFSSIGLTLRNRAFVYYVLSHLLFWIGFNAVVVAAPYLVTVIMGGSEADTSIALAVAFVVAVVSFPLIGRLSAARGLKFTMLLSMYALVAALVLWGFVGRWPGSVPVFWQGLAVFFVAGFSVGGLFVVPNALVAEIVDYDERLTGMRREAMFFGVQGLLVKIAMGFSTFGATQLLEVERFLGGQVAGVSLVGPIAGLFVLVGAFVFFGYRENVVRGTDQTVPPLSSKI